jgi:hypothetical protein
MNQHLSLWAIRHFEIFAIRHQHISFLAFPKIVKPFSKRSIRCYEWLRTPRHVVGGKVKQ